MQFDWEFWIDFNDRHIPDGGGGSITVTAETLADAIDWANARSIETVELLDSYGDNMVGIYFLNNTPFGVVNLCKANTAMDIDGPSRMFDEGEDDWIKRVDAFIAEKLAE